MLDERLPDDEPIYVISIAAKLVDMHPQTLRYYDRIGLLRPTRTSGRIRLYSRSDVSTLRKISRLTEDLGVNLAAVDVILNMSQKIEDLQRELDAVQEQAETHIQALRRQIRELKERESRGKEDAQVINVSAIEVKRRPEEGSHDRE